MVTLTLSTQHWNMKLFEVCMLVLYAHLLHIMAGYKNLKTLYVSDYEHILMSVFNPMCSQSWTNVHQHGPSFLNTTIPHWQWMCLTYLGILERLDENLDRFLIWSACHAPQLLVHGPQTRDRSTVNSENINIIICNCEANFSQQSDYLHSFWSMTNTCLAWKVTNDSKPTKQNYSHIKNQ